MISKSVSGIGNEIDIQSNLINNMAIVIIGNNNRIMIEQDVVVKANLNINMECNNSIIHIRANTSFESTDISMAEDDNFVKIGNDCMFALGTTILATDFHSIINKNDGKRLNIGKGVEIEDHVWIASGVKILKNTKISNNSIIAAGAIVCGRFPQDCVLGGIPAKIIEKNVTWCRSLVKNEDIKVPSKIIQAPIEYYIEKSLTNTNYELHGWAILPNVTTLESKFLFLVITKKSKKYYPGYHYNSKDVSDQFQNPNYGFSRFMTIIGISISEIIEIQCIIVQDNIGYARKIYSNN